MKKEVLNNALAKLFTIENNIIQMTDDQNFEGLQYRNDTFSRTTMIYVVRLAQWTIKNQETKYLKLLSIKKSSLIKKRVEINFVLTSGNWDRFK